MANQSGTKSPFDGSGGGASGGLTFQQASAPRQQRAGSDPYVTNQAPGGPLPFGPPVQAAGAPIAGTPGVPLPVSFKGK